MRVYNYSVFKKLFVPVKTMNLGLLTRRKNVYDAFVEGIKRMENAGADRVILAIGECEPDLSYAGRWIEEGQNSFYPAHTLTGKEREYEIKEVSHEVIALVLPHVMSLRVYDGPGIESARRTRINPFLPRLRMGSSLKFLTRLGIYDLREYAKFAEKQGWNYEDVARAVDSGIEEYREISKRLLHDAIETRGFRTVTTTNDVLSEARRNIHQAQKETRSERFARDVADKIRKPIKSIKTDQNVDSTRA